jgi:hypothetical protein
MTLTIMVLGMAVVTYAVKAGIFLLGERVAFPPLLREALSFVPVTVLTAIVVPMVLSPHNQGLELPGEIRSSWPRWRPPGQPHLQAPAPDHHRGPGGVLRLATGGAGVGPYDWAISWRASERFPPSIQRSRPAPSLTAFPFSCLFLPISPLPR